MFFRPFVAFICRALKGLVTPDARMIDEFECVSSVGLAILLAHLIGAHDVVWAAITGLVLMRGHVIETLTRAAMRIAGTVCGAGLALMMLPLATHSIASAAGLAGVVGGIGLYGMLTTKRGYAWLLFAITFEMILLGKLELPTSNAFYMSATRILEVLAGTAACLTVSLATTLTARRRWPALRPAPAIGKGWQPHTMRHAAQAGATVALLPFLHRWLGMGELAQAAATILAVMVVPIDGLGSSGLASVSQRLLNRIAGCMVGAILAAIVLIIARGSPPILLAATGLGVIIGRHVENGGGGRAYAGLQFTLVIIMALVPDVYTDVTIEPAVLRLISIFIGMAMLAPVLLTWHLLDLHAKDDKSESASRTG